jgi:hypothetical protein
MKGLFFITPGRRSADNRPAWCPAGAGLEGPGGQTKKNQLNAPAARKPTKVTKQGSTTNLVSARLSSLSWRAALVSMTLPATIPATTGGCTLVTIGRRTCTLSPKEIRRLVLFGRTVPLRFPDDTVDKESFLTPHPGRKAIEFHKGTTRWLLPKKVFSKVVPGERPVAEPARMPVIPMVD